MQKISKQQKEATNELTTDLVNRIWIEINIYKRKGEFRVYPDLVKYCTYGVMRDIDNGYWDKPKEFILEKALTKVLFEHE